MTELAVPSGSLLMVRHGQTASNVVHRLDCRPPGAPLTELGHQQARALVDTLAGVDLAAVVSSVAIRAQQTAAPVAAATGLAVQVLDGVQETDAGVLEDREDRDAHLEFVRVYGAWHAGNLDERVTGGESGRQVLERFAPVVQQLRAQHLQQGSSGSVMLVSHGAAIRLVAAQLAGVDGAFAATYSLPNTAIVVLQPTADGWKCLRWDTHTPPFRAPATPHVEGPA